MESAESGVCYGTADMVEIGEKLSELRHARLLTQQELADAAEISVQALRSLEAGRVRHPRRGNVRKLADALGVAALDLADPGLSAAQVLRRAERNGSRDGWPMVASFAPLPLSVSLALLALGHLLAAHGVG